LLKCLPRQLTFVEELRGGMRDQLYGVQLTSIIGTHFCGCSYHAKAITKQRKVSPIPPTCWGKSAADLGINLAANFMNCVHNFLPASDMLRIPDSGCILPLSSRTTLSWRDKKNFSDSDYCKAYPCLVMRIPSETMSPAPPRTRWT
jgi:hypothetical protein